MVKVKNYPLKSLSWETVLKDIQNRYPDVSHMTIEQLDEVLNGTSAGYPILIDVREKVEYDMSHLREGIYADPSGNWRMALQNIPFDRLIVVYCSVGERSASFARKLKQGGYSRIFNLEGGIFKWANSGRPVYREDKMVKEVHPFNDNWGQLLNRNYRK